MLVASLQSSFCLRNIGTNRSPRADSPQIVRKRQRRIQPRKKRLSAKFENDFFLLPCRRPNGGTAETIVSSRSSHHLARGEREREGGNPNVAIYPLKHPNPLSVFTVRNSPEGKHRGENVIVFVFFWTQLPKCRWHHRAKHRLVWWLTTQECAKKRLNHHKFWIKKKMTKIELQSVNITWTPRQLQMFYLPQKSKTGLIISGSTENCLYFSDSFVVWTCNVLQNIMLTGQSRSRITNVFTLDERRLYEHLFFSLQRL